MRWNFRFMLSNITFFGMISSTQRLDGLSSLVGDDKHICMWDLEKCSLDDAKRTLKNVQVKYNLGEIFIVSDYEKSFRGWCFKIVDLRTLIKIIVDTDYIDYSFLYYTVKRQEATLRISNKMGRKPQKIVYIIDGKKYPIPLHMKHIVYDTGLEKVGKTINIGGRAKKKIPLGIEEVDTIG